MSGLPVLSAAPVTIRHLKQGTGTGQVVVLGATLLPQPRGGVNGRRGYQSGTYEAPLNEEGTATISFPNTVGDDGVLHRRRFLILTDANYHPGDEWIEVSQANRPLFVGTPTGATKTRGQVTLRLTDGQWLLRKQRETAAGFWCHAPRDVFKHYTKAWTTLIADDFTAGADAARWTKVNATDLTGAVRLAGLSPPDGSITAITGYWGSINAATERAWRAEMSYTSKAPLAAIGLAMVDSGGTIHLSVQRGSPSAGTGPVIVRRLTDTRFTKIISNPTDGTLAIEVRDRWVYFYVSGQLMAVEEYLDTGALTLKVFVSKIGGVPDPTTDIQSVLLRRADPYLMRGSDNGDYRIPGALPSGGLQGSYYDDADLRQFSGGDVYFRRVLDPTRQPYARRQDATLNFPSASPVAFQPAGPINGESFTARWTGAIYLDLATADVTLRVTDFSQSARVWVGKTMYGDQLFDRWGGGGAPPLTSGSMRTHLGGSLSGWYPIRVDWLQSTGANGFTLQQSIGGGAYAIVPATSLSPYGIYDTVVRYDSHAEQLKAIAETFGLQYRCEPRALESGLFPAEVVPRVRVGRDTDKVLTPAESTDAAVEINAEDVCDTLLADAAGISDPENSAQLTAENINYVSVREAAAVDRHMMVLSEYESLTDITDPGLLRSRLDSLLGLRSTVWEEVGARPRGHRELRDTFPLTGALAAFAWEPGDAIRVNDPDLDVDDLTPRQIIAPAWTFAPDGLGSPTIRFRQRPRDQQKALRTLVRSALLPQRNYQGTLVAITGSHASSPAVAAVPDDFTRCSLPLDTTSVVRADLVVHAKGDTSAGTIFVNGVTTSLTVVSPGRYDVLAYVARSTGPRMFARITGHTSSCEYALELLIRV